MKSSSILPPLTLAIWTILLFYDVSEAAFGGGLLWMILLLGSATVSERAENRVLDVALSKKFGVEARFPRRGLRKRQVRSDNTLRLASGTVTDHATLEMACSSSCALDRRELALLQSLKTNNQ